MRREPLVSVPAITQQARVRAQQTAYAHASLVCYSVVNTRSWVSDVCLQSPVDALLNQYHVHSQLPLTLHLRTQRQIAQLREYQQLKESLQSAQVWLASYTSMVYAFHTWYDAASTHMHANMVRPCSKGG